jgi:hypothetical protein
MFLNELVKGYQVPGTRLTVKTGEIIREGNTRETRKNAKAEFLCACGTTKIIRVRCVGKNTKSCGCLVIDASRNQGFANRTHGESNKTPEWDAWSNMKRRVRPTSKDAKNYFDRGIIVSERYDNSFENFLEDVGRRPSPQHSLDRINNDKGYIPGNIKWATKEQQMSNQRKNIKYNGETMSQAARRLNIKPTTIWRRINILGWSIETAFNTPKQGYY